MTPKEKAQEIYIKIYSVPIVNNNKDYHYHIGDVIKNSAKTMKDNTDHVKVLALICVDEMMKQLDTFDLSVLQYDKKLKYLEELKQEIENL